jgi:hypothetical protein
MDAEKRVPIKLRPVARKHAGKITEPYRIMERLLAECDEFEPIREAKIRMYWRKDWQADVDGVIVGAQCAKASDRERLLAEEHGESVDLIILLPEKAWPTLDDTEKEHRLYHELCHFAPALDSNGDQKQDEKDRPLWRLKRHPITAFPSEVRRYGVDRILDHNGRMLEAAEASDTPLFNAQNGDGKTRDTGWRVRPIDGNLDIPAGTIKALERKGIVTLGELTDTINVSPMAWHVGVPGVGAAAAQKVSDAYAAFWAKHPEYAEAG